VANIRGYFTNEISQAAAGGGRTPATGEVMASKPA